jgi:hypothetical protein
MDAPNSALKWYIPMSNALYSRNTLFKQETRGKLVLASDWMQHTCNTEASSKRELGQEIPARAEVVQASDAAVMWLAVTARYSETFILGPQ